MLASNLSFGPDYYLDALNSSAYIGLSNDIFAWLSGSFVSLPASKMYSLNFVASVFSYFSLIKEFSKFL